MRRTYRRRAQIRQRCDLFDPEIVNRLAGAQVVPGIFFGWRSFHVISPFLLPRSVPRIAL
jgi:hypothetical protein